MIEPINKITYRGFTIEAHMDEDPESPRDWDNLGTMICWHRRYDLGDKHEFAQPDDFLEWLKSEKAIVLPLYLADHGNIWMSTRRDCYPFNCPWDSGQVGWIYTTLAKIRENFKCKHVTKSTKTKANKALINEVAVYSDYISGEVYGWIAVSPSGETVDSCWGYYGDADDSGLWQDARAAVDAAIRQAMAVRAKQVKGWIRNNVPLIYREPLEL